MKTIKSKKDFERVFKGGRRLSHPLVRVTLMRAREGSERRAAFVAAKRLGNAVCRNRCKRVLRAAAAEADFPPEGLEAILFATPATKAKSSSEVAEALRQLVGRMKAW